MHLSYNFIKTYFKHLLIGLVTRSRKASVSALTTTVPLLVAAYMSGNLDEAAFAAAIAAGGAAFAATWKVKNTR